MLQIGERYGVDLHEVPMVGDTLRDVQAGQAAGCPTHLVRTGKAGMLDEAELAVMLQQVPGTKVHADLGAFADAIIQEERALRGLKGDSETGFSRL
jgi:D-glycero-D-manno-heptose 1,7-bisphosphate phosphatase